MPKNSLWGGEYGLMHGSILPITIPPVPGNARDKSSPLGPGVGNCLKQFCPEGRGAGQIPDLVEKTAYFQGKSLEFVADWLEKNNLLKLKSVFKSTVIINMCYKLLNEGAFDAYSNGWHSSQTKKYFFSVFV